MSTSSTFNLGLVNNRLGVLSDQIEELGPYNGLDSDSTAAADIRIIKGCRNCHRC